MRRWDNVCLYLDKDSGAQEKTMNSPVVFIYALCEPGTRTIRYIGKTDNLKRRFSAHIFESSKTKTHLGNWLRSLAGEKPVLVVLHEVTKIECWAEEERRYISCARAMGMKLVNGTDGGEGAPGHIPTPETRAKISYAHRGVPKSPQHRAAMVGHVRSPEHCAAISAVQKGIPKSPEHRAAMKGPLSPEHCAAISRAATIRWEKMYAGIIPMRKPRGKALKKK